ncbi:MAG: hypothetical protein H6Q18_127 [Bacteroidetes bacterium]|nr:hypothetical protein [Bacteroidota bacterium]
MSPDFYKALEISGIGIAGVFIFMTIFFFVIIGLDKAFPNEKKQEKTALKTDENSVNE